MTQFGSIFRTDCKYLKSLTFGKEEELVLGAFLPGIVHPASDVLKLFQVGKGEDWLLGLADEVTTYYRTPALNHEEGHKPHETVNKKVTEYALKSTPRLVLSCHVLYTHQYTHLYTSGSIRGC
ncbi:hypothetical protein Y1Q_0002955 [Alligator mississippiensis]|uniref:Uncharacterized protein n=1 Tax=Alligator mississippiensis TaxID=8496 RepID=A0A151MCZ1_ALLMI|nr:hypothetical protein Y1Q_0002955 [Alligator mississippiensis]